MPIKASISGIRGTTDDNTGLRPDLVSKYVLAYGSWLQSRYEYQTTVVLGRDSRKSGHLYIDIVKNTLNYLGINVIDLGLVTTPTTELAVPEFKAQGAIIITASHNLENWNALKFLNDKGEFLNEEDIKELLSIYKKEDFMGMSDLAIENVIVEDFTKFHIKKIIALKAITVTSIKKANFKVVVDGVNSVGGPALISLLEELGVKDIIELHCDNSGKFSHNPEPSEENLSELKELVKKEKADLGLAVDPDGDRLAIVCENGSFFGEEYTLVAVADYILSQFGPGNTVSNLSSSRALKDLTEKYKGKHFSAPVGEINVIETMKKQAARIGGEGNGGVIYPALHYGRDALVGVALFLNYLAISHKPCSKLKEALPKYHLNKYKVDIDSDIKVEDIFKKLKKEYKNEKFDERDGLKIDLEDSWVHLRASNTEPIIRLYIEAKTKKEADSLYNKVIKIINK